MATPGIWLDELPIDVCTRISSFLPTTQLSTPLTCEQRTFENECNQTPSALNLAALSNYQSQAAQCRSLHIEPYQHSHPWAHCEYTNHLPQVCTILNRDVRHISIPLDFPGFTELTTILTLPSIISAAIPYNPTLLRPLIFARSVKELQLQPTRDHPVLGKEINLLPDLLRACPIQKLRLHCQWCSDDDFQNSEQHPCFARTLLEGLEDDPAGNSIRSLRIICPSQFLGPLTATVRFFPNLEEFVLEHRDLFAETFAETPLDIELSSDFEDRLPTLKSVGMLHISTVEHLVPVVGIRLTILASRWLLESEDLLILRACENLKSVDLVLAEGAERYFPKNLCDLHSISLSWQPRDLSGPSEEYYSPNQNFFIELVRRNKYLRNLQLRNVRISHHALEETLSYAGNRLQTLGLPVFHQGEYYPVNRFHEAIWLIIRHNQGLSDLEFFPSSCDTQEIQRCIYEHEGSCSWNSHTFCGLHLRRVDRMMRVLKLRVPGLSAESLQKLEWTFLPCS